MSPTAPRHCMVVHAYYPVGETRVQREAEALVAAGYDVDVVCLRDPAEPERENINGVEVHRLPVQVAKASLARQLASYLHFFARATARVTRLHRAAPYHSVQVHNLPDFLVFCAAVPKLRGVPVVLDLHDLMPEFYAGRFGDDRAWMLRLVRLQERLACRFADHVITVSDHWRDDLIARGVAPEKCSVVMNLADDRLFTPRPRGEDAVGDPSEFRLLYHGSITYRYGLDVAVRAVARLRDEIPGLRLTVLGRGDFMDDLFALRDELDLGEHVELRDELVPVEELPDLIAAADLGVVPSRDDVFTDGLVPTKLMEYAAMGVPSVAARTTAIDRYFRDSGVAFFTPGDVDDLADRIRELYHDRGRLAALAAETTRFTSRYSWERLGAEYVALVDALGEVRGDVRAQAATGAVGAVSAARRAGE